jgi:predicted alpha/beta hydrolase family esterase
MTTLFIPSLGGAEPPYWQRRWEAELDDAETVGQANWNELDLGEQLAALVVQLRRAPGSILVGHALGATLIAHLAASHPELNVGGALLVAPADPERGWSLVPGAETLAPLPLEPFSFPAMLVASRTDCNMTPKRAHIFANIWEAAFIDAANVGYDRVERDRRAWPEGLRLLDQLRGACDFARRMERRPALRLVAG